MVLYHKGTKTMAQGFGGTDLTLKSGVSHSWIGVHVRRAVLPYVRYCLKIALLQESSSDVAFVADRVELLLKQAQRFGLLTRAQCLEYLGSHFRAALDAPPRKTDYQVGLHLRKFCNGNGLKALDFANAPDIWFVAFLRWPSLRCQ